MSKITAQLQANIASAVAGGGLVWAAQVLSTRRMILALIATPGLVELLCFSILVWLVAKWRSVAQNHLNSVKLAPKNG